MNEKRGGILWVDGPISRGGRQRDGGAATVPTRSRSLPEWQEFRSPDFDAIRDSLDAHPVIFDGRNLYDPALVRSFGCVTSRSAGRRSGC